MNRLIFAAALLVLSLTGCATVVTEAPVDKKVALATQTDVPPLKIKKKVWYVLWGLVPITTNTTAEMMGLCKEMVRSKIYYGIDDLLINLVLGNLSVMTLTVELECK